MNIIPGLFKSSRNTSAIMARARAVTRLLDMGWADHTGYSYEACVCADYAEPSSKSSTGLLHNPASAVQVDSDYAGEDH